MSESRSPLAADHSGQLRNNGLRPSRHPAATPCSRSKPASRARRSAFRPQCRGQIPDDHQCLADALALVIFFASRPARTASMVIPGTVIANGGQGDEAVIKDSAIGVGCGFERRRRCPQARPACPGPTRMRTSGRRTKTDYGAWSSRIPLSQH